MSINTIQFLCKTQTHLSFFSLSFKSHSNVAIASPKPLSPLRCISTIDSQTQQSFSVSYLVDSCGLSPEKALSASKHVNFENPERPNSVLNLFKSHKFSDSHISLIVSKLPELLTYHPDKTLLPKFNFFYSNGLSNPELVKLLSSYPYLLTRSLENSMIPNFNLLKDLLQSLDVHAMKVIKSYPRLLDSSVGTFLLPSVKILRESNVPEPQIASLLRVKPAALCKNPEKLREILEEVRELGFNFTEKNYVYAVNVIVSVSKSTREKKINVYKRWGWSEEDVLGAFHRFPHLLKMSEDNINETMDYFVNEMKWESLIFTKWPDVLGMSLKKRIVPRCSVIIDLRSRGLIDGNITILPNQVLKPSEDLFLERFVIPYQNEAPHLMKLYHNEL